MPILPPVEGELAREARMAARELRIAQPRVSDLVRGKWDKFSLDVLIELATRAGCKVPLEMV